MAGRVAVGVDVGGTKMAVGLVAADGTVLDRRRLDTPAADPDGIVAAAAQAAQDLSARHGLADVPTGVGAAGLVDRDGVMRYAPNIGWRDFPLRARLQARLDGHVTVDNDATAAAWGEFVCGAGRDASEAMVMLTVGTGVGGGLVLRGEPMRGAHGFGAEFGHMVIAEGGLRCPCGTRGCLEAYASGTAIGRRAEARRAAGDLPADSALQRPEALTGKQVTLAAHDGDPAAREVLAEVGFWLGVGIASLVNALDPEVVVVGGGGMRAGDLLLEPARAAVAERVMGQDYRGLPPVVGAALRDDGGLVGAALLALQDTRSG